MSVNVILLPGNLIQPDGFQEFHDILPAVVMRCAGVILTHKDDGHIGEELRQFMARLHHSGGIHGD